MKGRARVIILADDADDEGDMIEYLLEHPYQANDFKPLTRDEVYDRRQKLTSLYLSSNTW